MWTKWFLIFSFSLFKWAWKLKVIIIEYQNCSNLNFNFLCAWCSPLSDSFNLVTLSVQLSANFKKMKLSQTVVILPGSHISGGGREGGRWHCQGPIFQPADFTQSSSCHSFISEKFAPMPGNLAALNYILPCLKHGFSPPLVLVEINPKTLYMQR